MRKTKIKLLVISALILAVLPGLYNNLIVRHYELVSNKIKGNIRFALVTDLHSCKYGEHQEKLINAVIAEKPDVVLLGGDIFDDKLPPGNTEDFLRGIAGKFPIYYVTGNHECWCEWDSFDSYMSLLKELGIKRLRGDIDEIEINGSKINICGVDDPEIDIRIAAAEGYKIVPQNDEDKKHNIGFSEQMNRIKNVMDNENYSILISHRPELNKIYSDNGFDLALCGHAHGGQWRVPGVLNGLIAPNQGLFPKYAGGFFDFGNTKMIVSRGLARESTIVPRIYNRPELVIITVSDK